jgi:hypothetical protein
MLLIAGLTCALLAWPAVFYSSKAEAVEREMVREFGHQWKFIRHVA